MIPTAVFLCFMDVILITRLFFQFRDDPITLKHTMYKTILELIALLIFSWNYWLLVILFVVILLNWASFVTEKRFNRLKLSRLSFLFLYLIIFSILFSANSDIHFNSSLISFIANSETSFILVAFFKKVAWNNIWVVLTGFLLVLNESNIFIRYLMESLHLVPKMKSRKPERTIDTQEYNRGRVIGILERILIYYFVLNNTLSAVGFILAAKGITRFKELENREFAEYFLIGTLLSAIISGAIALLIRGIL